jgi:hypothetical protein
MGKSINEKKYRKAKAGGKQAPHLIIREKKSKTSAKSGTRT